MEKLFAKIKKEALSPDEKAKIYSDLQSFVAKNPIQNIKSPFYSEWSVFKQRMFVVPVAIALIFVLTGGVVFASKNSLPGNMLYSVKLLNEKVESLTTFSPKAQAEIEVSHAISRLQEVEQLVSLEEQLSRKTKEEIRNNFEAKTQGAIDRINKLKDSGQVEDATKIQSDFEKAINRHGEALGEISDDDDTDMISDIHSRFEDRSNRSEDKGEVKGAKTRNQRESSDSQKSKNNDD